MKALAAPAASQPGLSPPLKWAGGKRWQLQYLRPLWERSRSDRLVEPFCGGLSVALGLMPKRALLNDVNMHLVNFYSCLKHGLSVGLHLANSKAVYYRYRRRFNRLLKQGGSNGVEAATLFYYLNRTGYNGLCRFNQSGEFNVPFGRYKKLTYRTEFLDYASVLRRWSFSSADFAELDLANSDFVYADPPYDVDFTQYSQNGFGWDEQVRAAEWLARHRGPVVLSNQATPRIISLYKSLGFTLTFLKAPRRISCTGDRTPAKEVLALRNLDPDYGAP